MKIKFSRRLVKIISRKASDALFSGDRRAYNRAKALELLAESHSPRDVASVLKLSEETIRRYITGIVTFGVSFLAPKKSGGRPPKLSKAQRAKLKMELLLSPTRHGFHGGLWTSPMISRLIERMFGVIHSAAYLPRLLKSIGLSWQKTATKNYRQDATALANWKANIWPKILRKAKRRKAKIYFEDECSFSLSTTQGYSWGECGNQPICDTTGSKANVKVFGAIEYFTGKLIAYTTEEQLQASTYIEYLKFVLKNTKGKLIWIHDGAGYHRSSEVGDFLATTKRIELILLPPYCPELNPIEKLWKKIKQTGTHNRFFENILALRLQVEGMISYFEQNTDEVKSLMPDPA